MLFSQCMALICTVPAFLSYFRSLFSYSASTRLPSSTKVALSPRQLSSRCLIYLPFSTFILPASATKFTCPKTFFLHQASTTSPSTQKPHTTPEAQLEPSQPHPSHAASPPHSSQQTTCPRKTHSHSRFPHCSRSAAFPRSPAGSQERVCTRAEARRAGIPWAGSDTCRLPGRAGGSMSGGWRVPGDGVLPFGLCWSLLASRL